MTRLRLTTKVYDGARRTIRWLHDYIDILTPLLTMIVQLIHSVDLHCITS